MTENDRQSAISTFFQGKSVFITGATGFVGKQIIEKLLRSCSGIDRIYVLIRSKRGADAHERIRHFCALPLFDQVRLLRPDFQSKIIPIAGDLTKVNFDLNIEDEQILIQNCHIVINSGASVRFDDPLKQAIQSNVFSMQTIIQLCKKIKHLQSFVHVSTAYVHPYRTDIDEVIYPMNENPNHFLESLQCVDQKLFDVFAKKVLEKYPNAYAYSKSLAECLLLQQGNGLPIAIIRPSIIGAAWREPIPGWIDGYAGATGLMIAVGKRFVRILLSRSMVDLPIIPVDIVANMTVAIAWFTATHRNPLSTPTIYNCCSGRNSKAGLSFNDFSRILITAEKAIGFEDYSIIGPSVSFTMNRPYYYFHRYTVELLPAYLLDILAWLTFRKPRMVRLCGKLENLQLSLRYFCEHQWIFTNHNSQFLLNQMNPIDRQEFNFDLTGLNWSSYMRDYCIGIKKYLLKEELSPPSKYSSLLSNFKRLFSRKIRRYLSIFFFFAVTWILRQMFIKRLRFLWKTFNFILQTFFQRDRKKIFHSLK